MFKQSKLLPPSLDGCVLRTRLLQRLGSSGALALLSAPAGFGKSTLAAQWLQVEGGGSWLSLDGSDQAGPSFWINLIGSLRCQWPGFGATALTLLQEKHYHPDAIVASLIEDLAEWRAHSQQPANRLVLDDLYQLEQSPHLPLLLRFLRQCGGVVQILLVSRSPAFLIADGILDPAAVDVIDQHQLAFNRDEVDALAARFDLQLSEPVLDRLLASTEGWVTPIRMILRQVRNDGDARRWNEAWLAGQRVSLEPLIQEHYYSQSAAHRQLLACLSLPPRFDRELARQLATPEVVDTLLTDTFIIRLQEPGWLKIHDLYRAFLREQFVQLSSTLQNQTALTVAQWHAKHGSWWQAMDTLLQQGTADDLRHFMAQHYHHWLKLGAQEVLNYAAGLLAEQDIQNHPRWCLIFLWGRSDRLTFAQCDRYVSHALGQARQLENGADIIAELYSLASYCALVKGEPERALQDAQLALDWSRQSQAPQRSRAQLTLGLLAYMEGQMGKASATLAQALVWAEEEQHIYHTVLAVGYWMATLYQAGRFDEAMQIRERTKHWLQENAPGEMPAVFWLDLPAINILIAQGAIEEAHRQLKHFLQFADHAVPSLRTALIYYLAIQVHYSRGDHHAVLEFLSRLDGVQDKLALEWTWGWPSAPALRRLLTVTHAREGVQAWYQEHPVQVSNCIGFQQIEECLLDATVLVTLAQWDAAADIALQLERDAVAQQRVMHRLQALIVLGNVEWLRKERNHPYIEAAELLARQIGAEGILQREARWPVSSPQDEQAPSLVNEANLADVAISKREHEVLVLLAQGMPDKEIAQQLAISLHTAKTHMKNILRKLDVKNRTEALVSARARGIL